MYSRNFSQTTIVAVLVLVLISNSVALAGRWVYTGAGWKWFEYCSVSPTADTYVDNLDPSPHGGEPDLHVGATSGDPAQITRTYLKFDLSVLPPNSTIAGARLSLHSSAVGENPKIEVVAHLVEDQDWNESITWPGPYTGSSAGDTQTAGTSNRWYSWNVTADAQLMLATGVTFLSEALIELDEGGRPQSCIFNSSESSDPNFGPYLEIWYDPGGYVLATGTEAYRAISANLTFDGSPGLAPIPEGFFGPGSDPFEGTIEFDEDEEPLIPPDSFFDVVMERTEGGFLPDPGGSDMIDTQMVELNLVSAAPIIVTSSTNPDFPAEYDVSVELIGLGTGQTLIIGNDDRTGGTFRYTLSPQWRILFTPRESGLVEKELLIPGPMYPAPFEVLQESPYSWTNTAFEDDPPGGYDAFYPASGEGTLHGTLLYAGMPTGELNLLPPQQVNTSFMLNSFEEWKAAFDANLIEPMSPVEWEDYINGWGDPSYIHEGNEYPIDINFVEPDLYVYEGNEVDPCCPNEPGLVMEWGDPCTSTTDHNYASAWKYVYPVDPDVSNSIITVTVMPPSASAITAISFSMIDQAGLMRSWWWSVPGVIPYDVGTTVTIDASKTGLAATSPQATGYNSAPGFDNRKIMSFAADENGTWFPSSAVPPPGQTVANLWNYWYNLAVTPKTPSVHVMSKYYVKWSQRPDVINSDDPKLIRGWDEPSNYYWKPIVADDWRCTDERPITDIHWWGSFLGWSQPYPPAVLPKAFHIGIWTDVPAGAFSHPGFLVWENYCDSWVWNFFGYDVPPIGGEQDPGFYDKEACFQFNQLLSEDEWFYQDPNAVWDTDGDPNSAVYWLSIAAIYDMTDIVQHPWGWKTREPHWNDDAVVIYDVEIPPVDFLPFDPPPPSWPPSTGSAFKAGYPIEYPAGASWDMSFELTTNEPDPNQTFADLDYDGVVNFNDLAILAAQWLDTAP